MGSRRLLPLALVLGVLLRALGLIGDALPILEAPLVGSGLVGTLLFVADGQEELVEEVLLTVLAHELQDDLTIDLMVHRDTGGQRVARDVGLGGRSLQVLAGLSLRELLLGLDRRRGLLRRRAPGSRFRHQMPLLPEFLPALEAVELPVGVVPLAWGLDCFAARRDAEKRLAVASLEVLQELLLLLEILLELAELLFGLALFFALGLGDLLPTPSAGRTDLVARLGGHEEPSFELTFLILALHHLGWCRLRDDLRGRRLQRLLDGAELLLLELFCSRLEGGLAVFDAGQAQGGVVRVVHVPYRLLPASFICGRTYRKSNSAFEMPRHSSKNHLFCQ